MKICEYHVNKRGTSITSTYNIIHLSENQDDNNVRSANKMDVPLIELILVATV